MIVDKTGSSNSRPERLNELKKAISDLTLLQNSHSAHIPEGKAMDVEELIEMIRKSRVVGVAGVREIPVSNLQQMRGRLRGNVEIRMVRNTIARRALEASAPDIRPLADFIEDQTALIFSDDDNMACIRDKMARNILEKFKPFKPIEGEIVRTKAEDCQLKANSEKLGAVGSIKQTTQEGLYRIKPQDYLDVSSPGTNQIQNNEACEKSPKHVHVKIPGKRSFCFEDISESETIGTLTEKIADRLGVDKRNWGIYVAGPREFLPNNAKVREIKINHDKNLHFLPRTVIR